MCKHGLVQELLDYACSLQEFRGAKDCNVSGPIPLWIVLAAQMRLSQNKCMEYAVWLQMVPRWL